MTTESDSRSDLHGGSVHIPRSRGALSGITLIILGAWAAIIPFLGPLFHYGYTPAQAWTWTAARGWLEVLPGAVALVAGVLILMSTNRVTAVVAGWLGVAAGVWLVIGRDLATWLHLGSPGKPMSSQSFLAMLESIGLFSGIGAAIAVVAAIAVGRLSVRSVRDVRAAQRSKRRRDKERSKISDDAYEAGRRDEARAHEHDAAYGAGRRDEALAHEHDGAYGAGRRDDALAHEHDGAATQVTEEHTAKHGGLRERVRTLTHHGGSSSDGSTEGSTATSSEGSTATSSEGSTAADTTEYRGEHSR